MTTRRQIHIATPLDRITLVRTPSIPKIFGFWRERGISTSYIDRVGPWVPAWAHKSRTRGRRYDENLFRPFALEIGVSAACGSRYFSLPSYRCLTSSAAEDDERRGPRRRRRALFSFPHLLKTSRQQASAQARRKPLSGHRSMSKLVGTRQPQGEGSQQCHIDGQAFQK